MGTRVSWSGTGRGSKYPQPVSPMHGWSHRGPLLMVREKGTASLAKAITALGWKKYHQETSLRARYGAAGIV